MRRGAALDEAEIVQISALEHFVYCARQCALIHVDGLWFDNEHTIRGAAGHHRADTANDRFERGVQVLRHLPLWSERHGLAGRADAVSVDAQGHMVPVEYKIGGRHGDAASLQVCAQALCLEEMFSVEVALGYVWFAANRRRTSVAIDQELRVRTISAVRAIRAMQHSSILPTAVDDARCDHCQFADHCLPSISAHPERVDDYLATHVRCAS